MSASRGGPRLGRLRLPHLLRFHPPDLTLLAKRSGGEYPAEKVHRIVDGRKPLTGHGGPDMPIWGDAFRGRGALWARAPAPGPAARPARTAPPRAGRLRGLGGTHIVRGAGRGQGLRDGQDRGGGHGGRLAACEFRPLPARPMRIHEVADTSAVSSLEREVRAAFAALPPDVVLQLRVPEALAGAEALRAARLRALAPPTANVTVAVRR